MVQERVQAKKKWTIRRFLSEDFDKHGFDARPLEGESPAESVVEGNVLLNEGITEMIDLLIGDSAAAYSEANAQIGVGDGTSGESAAHTGLVGAQKTYKAMESGYPTNASQKATFRSIFASGEANYDWQEFTVANTSGEVGDNLNRKQSNQGTKAAGQTWTIDLEITFS